MSLPEYLSLVQTSISSRGGNERIIFDPSVSNAMLSCYNIATKYAAVKRHKRPPVPIDVASRNTSETFDTTYTQFRFAAEDVNDLQTFKSIVESMKLNAEITAYDYIIIFELFTENKGVDSIC